MYPPFQGSIPFGPRLQEAVPERGGKGPERRSETDERGTWALRGETASEAWYSWAIIGRMALFTPRISDRIQKAEATPVRLDQRLRSITSNDGIAAKNPTFSPKFQEFEENFVFPLGYPIAKGSGQDEFQMDVDPFAGER